MGETTNIAWCDGTVNFWWGCTKVSPGCTHCYAATLSARYGYDEWGPGKPRRAIKGVRGTVQKLVARAKAESRRLRVFTNSMADFFDAEVEPAWRMAAWETILATAEHLDWLILTKRPENMAAMLPADWGAGWRNVILMVTAENQEMADLRVPILLATPAACRGVSYEPALGPINFDPPSCPSHGYGAPFSAGDDGVTLFCDECFSEAEYGGWLDGLNGGIGWVIVGGESGPGARPFDLEWARETVRQCADSNGASCFVKQLGAIPVRATSDIDDTPTGLCLRDRKGGDPAEWPEDLRVREFPEVRA